MHSVARQDEGAYVGLASSFGKDRTISYKCRAPGATRFYASRARLTPIMAPSTPDRRSVAVEPSPDMQRQPSVPIQKGLTDRTC